MTPWSDPRWNQSSRISRERVTPPPRTTEWIPDREHPPDWWGPRNDIWTAEHRTQQEKEALCGQ